MPVSTNAIIGAVVVSALLFVLLAYPKQQSSSIYHSTQCGGIDSKLDAINTKLDALQKGGSTRSTGDGPSRPIQSPEPVSYGNYDPVALPTDPSCDDPIKVEGMRASVAACLSAGPKCTLEHRAPLQKAIHRMLTGIMIKFKQEGHSGENQGESNFLLSSCLSIKPETVCETGFNGGHSATSWLLGTSRGRYFGFDLGGHEYVRPCFQCLREIFGERLQLFLGNSEVTVPNFIENHVPVPLCDIVNVDGGHVGTVPRSDLKNFAKLSDDDTVIMIDDCSMVLQGNVVLPTWTKLIEEGFIKETEHPSWADRSVCVGRYIAL